MKKLNKFALRRSLPFLLLTLLFSTSYAIAAQTADWRPTLVKPKSGVFGQSETIHILLPKQLSAETLSHLALELDDIDVTSLVSLTGNQALGFWKCVRASISAKRACRRMQP
jgi:hypothetical protein